MKRMVTIIPMVLCLSCAPFLPETDNELCESVFSIRGVTKATDATDAKETNVKHWTVMLFDADNPDAWYYASSQGSSDITCTVRKGRSYRAYAIANYPQEGSDLFSPSMIEGENQLLQYTSLLSSNAADALVMFGTKELTELPSGRTPIPLKRLCSKISIEKISVAMDDDVYAGQEFVLNSIYLTNVYTCSSYGGDHSTPDDNPLCWYNAQGWHESGTHKGLDALVGDRGLGISIANGSSYVISHTYYAYPNSSSVDTTDDDWSIRHTRLVIEGTLGGKKYYYTITLPLMKRNNRYTITEATLKRPGSLNPEKTIPGILDTSMTITEDTWDSDYYTNEAS